MVRSWPTLNVQDCSPIPSRPAADPIGAPFKKPCAHLPVTHDGSVAKLQRTTFGGTYAIAAPDRFSQPARRRPDPADCERRRPSCRGRTLHIAGLFILPAGERL